MDAPVNAAQALPRLIERLGPAFRFIDARRNRTTTQQIAICGVPSPTFHEERRARFVKRLLAGSSLAGLRTDQAGNLVGLRKGTRGKRCVVVAAHLDTVFGREVSPRVVRTGRGGQVLAAPGIADNAGGLAAMLALVEALDAVGIRTRDDVLFAGTVGEEALGNLRGVRHLLHHAAFRRRVSGFIALDGANPRKLVTSAPAVRRYRITFSGPGGHSWSAFGTPNPVHAAGRLIARLASTRVPAAPKTTFNFGVVSDGADRDARVGVVVTAVPSSTAIELDLRSERADVLARLDAAFHAALGQAIEEERRRATQRVGALRVRVEQIGERSAGRTPRNARIVRAALDSYRRFGMPLRCVCTSTDATHPMSLGIPAVTAPQGGRGRNVHTIEERINIAGRERAIKAALLLVVRLAGL